MQIHTLKLKKRQKKKSVGRGGKKGTYSGRGNKGQKARSGVSIDPLFEGGRSSLVDRMKKIRGFKSIKAKALIVDIVKLGEKFKDGDLINRETLIKRGFFDKMETEGKKIKILGNSSIKIKLKIGQNILISAAAKKAVETAGGEIQKASKEAK
ncbi:50S ribosomal protein L15 [Patescibacteria group bacterium]|nr:50S ribosomal protein L15 [Patescibacteria group bacterium]